MNRVGIWTFGLIGSVAAHVGLLALLMIAVQPDPVENQPLPTSELEVQAYQLDRVEAQEQAPENQQMDANTPDGQSLNAGAIPRSDAKPAPPEPQTLRPDSSPLPAAKEISQTASTLPEAAANPVNIPDTETDIAPIPLVTATAQTLSQFTPSPSRLTATVQPAARTDPTKTKPARLSSANVPTQSARLAVVRSQTALPIAQPAVAIAPVSSPQGSIVLAALPAIKPAATLAPASAPLAQASPVTSALSVATPAVTVTQPKPALADALLNAPPELAALPVAKPTPSSLPQSEAQTSAIAPGKPDVVATLAQHTNAAFVQPITPNAKKLKAALAFSGGEGDVDPVSIAAFQSFMQPGDISANGDQLRDGVSGLLAQVPCSRMQVSFDPVTATLQVKGHIPEDGLRAPVLAALQAQMGANITVSDNILILPRPQCGALSGIAGVGLPQSTDQITNPLVIGNDTHAKVFSFAKGDLLSLDMTAPDYDAFIYLDYFDADGMVLHLEPNEYAPLRQANAQVAQQIGAKTMQDVGLKLVISPPYGQEIAVAFAASEPLYDGLRPIQEPAAQYLEWLQKQVAKAHARNPGFKGEWVYFFVSTAER